VSCATCGHGPHEKACRVLVNQGTVHECRCLCQHYQSTTPNPGTEIHDSIVRDKPGHPVYAPCAIEHCKYAELKARVEELERERDVLQREVHKYAKAAVQDEAKVVELEREVAREVADYESSFNLYDKATRALSEAYKAAHPDFPQDAWPDTTKVNVWAAEQITK
jgi:hypothetical protein